MNLIRTENLSRIFTRGEERISALNDISMRVSLGEYVAITGASGSGKSTLMYILGLLDTQTSGEYYLSDMPTLALTERERSRMRNQKIGFVFQGFHLLPRATALRNVALPLMYASSHSKGYTESRILQMSKEALDRVGLSDRMNHRPNELSGGQRQRVAIARALVQSPQLILADEPTGNLDSKTGEEIMRLFKELHTTGVTLIVVTHDTTVAARAQRTIHMKDGTIVEDHYASP